MTQHGLTAAQAETGLMNVLQKNIKPTKEARDALAYLAATVDKDIKKAFAVEGSSERGMERLFERIKKDAEALTDHSRNCGKVFQLIFGVCLPN